MKQLGGKFEFFDLPPLVSNVLYAQQKQLCWHSKISGGKLPQGRRQARVDAKLGRKMLLTELISNLTNIDSHPSTNCN